MAKSSDQVSIVVESSESINDRVKEYVLQKGDDLAFTKYFWKGCEPSDKDLSQYKKFAAVLQLHHAGAKRAT